MGYGLTAFLIPEKADAMIFGSGRKQLLDEVLEVLADRLASYDEQLIDDDASALFHAEALREIFAGKLTRKEDCGSIYGWAYELYCSSMGDWLSNSHFCPCDCEWFDALDQALRTHGVGLRFEKLLFDDFPIPVETDCQPCGGLWEHEKIMAARGPLQRAVSAIRDEDVHEALEEVASWVEQAAAVPGSVIVGFFG